MVRGEATRQYRNLSNLETFEDNSPPVNSCRLTSYLLVGTVAVGAGYNLYEEHPYLVCFGGWMLASAVLGLIVGMMFGEIIF